ncbi:MAG: zinc-binding dehydrogenase [Caldilineaceae bacterium]
MKTKAALQLAHGERLIIDEIEFPHPQPDQLVVKLFATGVCHTQIHWMNDPTRPRPFTLGHEGTGMVTHVGANVTHLQEGDHVIVTWVPRRHEFTRPPITPPPLTYRGEALHSLNVYTWAEDVLVNQAYVVPIAKDAPTDVSCIVGCAVLTGAGAVMRTTNVRPGQSVAIFGVGGVGLSAVRMAAILAAYPIIAVDLDDKKLALAKELGATHLVNANKEDAIATILAVSNGGVDFAYDAIGAPATIRQLLPVTRRGGPGAHNQGGVAVLIGVPSEEVRLDPRELLMAHRHFITSMGATIPDEDFPRFLRWHQEGKFPLDKLVTRRYRLEQINEAYGALKAGEILGRAIIEF